MKRATSKVWTMEEVLETVAALKKADYYIRIGDGTFAVCADEAGKDEVLRAIEESRNTWRIRYDAALFDESLLEDEK